MPGYRGVVRGSLVTVPLLTPRLQLRAYDAAADAAFVRDLYSREEVQRWIGDGTQRVRTLGEAREKIRRWQGLYSQHPVHGAWLVRTHERTRVGTVLLKPIPDSAADTAHDIEIGWHFHPHAWGHGYATEAAHAVLAHAFAAGLTRVVAVTHPANEASQAVCLRLGMTPRGLSRAYYDAECALFERTAPAAAPRGTCGEAPLTGAASSAAATEQKGTSDHG
ncbi:GNAT family N-acetyltransferase [Kocuria tytonis]|uniref:N-acetyltransferase n=1 Tax=Kocuria tytonis TaxID=2054280 RepID=A0A495ADV7_9MICC|nr:GNAT family N-acetyltransferase [Kocuria tytonis]RKQ37095.1 N-acetyltransferase [Kocuria tytonis]